MSSTSASTYKGHPVTEPRIRSYTSCRMKLSFAQWENPGKPRLLLIHGGKDHNRNWDSYVDALGADFDIVAPDLRGHGESQWSDSGCYYLAEFVVDIAALIEHLGWDSFSIVAHSLGTTIATFYCAAYPEKAEKLVGIEGLAMPRKLAQREAAKSAPERLRTFVEASHSSGRRKNREFSSMQEAVDRLLEQNPRFPGTVAHHLTVHGLRELENGHYSWKCDPMMDQRLRPELSDEERRALWQSIRCPILFIHGEKSWADNPLEDGTAEHFNTMQVVSIPGAGHWVHHDEPEQVTALIRDFLPGPTLRA